MRDCSHINKLSPFQLRFCLPWFSTYLPSYCWYMWAKCCSRFSILLPSILSWLSTFSARLCCEEPWLLVFQPGGKMENHWKRGEAIYLVLQKRGFCNGRKCGELTFHKKEDRPFGRPFCRPRGFRELGISRCLSVLTWMFYSRSQDSTPFWA